MSKIDIEEWIYDLFYSRTPFEKTDVNNTQELKEMIEKCFEISKQNDFILGFETLCLYIGVSSITFKSWLVENGERGEIARNALKEIIKGMNREHRKGRIQKDIWRFVTNNYKMWLSEYKNA